jgi:hypothetical protein
MRLGFVARRVAFAAIAALTSIAAAQPVIPVPGSPFPVIADSQTTLCNPDARFLFTAGPTNRLRVLNITGAAPTVVGDYFSSCAVTHGLARNPEGTRLYTVGFGSAFVAVHAVASNGALTQLETEPLSTSAISNSVRYVRSSDGDYVFVNENRNGANFVSRFAVEADGKLGPAVRYATGANSNGSGYFSSPRIVGNDAKGLLFVLNGSSVSAMKVGPGGVPNLLGVFPLPAGSASSGALAIDRDGTRLFAGLTNGFAAMWQVESTGLLTFNRTIPTGCFGSIDGMQVHPSGKILVSVDVVRLGVTDLTTGQALLTRNVSNCTGVETDRLGKRLYIGTSSGTLPVFDFNGYAIQQPPVGNGDSFDVDEDTSLEVPAPGVLANDTDADGDVLSAQLISGPAHGTLTLNPNGSFSYLPETDFNGVDGFTYKAKDAEGESGAIAVTITVGSVNDLPTSDAGIDQTLEATGPKTTVTLAGSGSDREGPVTYRWALGDEVLGESASLSAALPVGEHTLTLTVTDSVGATAADSVKVTVKDTTAPTILGVPANFSVTATDAFGAVASFASPVATDLVDGDVAVTLSNASGSAFHLGTTAVTVKAKDAAGNEATATFTVTVRYEWSGLLDPLGSRSIKAGSTVPLKFQLTGASAGIQNAQGMFTVAGGAGGSFRYDPDADVYACHWSTKGLKPGTYELRVDLGDGAVRTTTVTLK